MPSRRSLVLITYLLVLAAIGAGVMWFVLDLGAALCEGQSPGVCEAQQDDADPWQVAFFVLLTSAVLTSIWAWRPSSLREAATSLRADRSRFRLILVAAAVLILLIAAGLAAQSAAIVA